MRRLWTTTVPSLDYISAAQVHIPEPAPTVAVGELPPAQAIAGAGSPHQALLEGYTTPGALLYQHQLISYRPLV